MWTCVTFLDALITWNFVESKGKCIYVCLYNMLIFKYICVCRGTHICIYKNDALYFDLCKRIPTG